MAKVYDVAVRFMRKVQVKEYEPVEAEVTLKAQTEDGEDHVALLSRLGSDARTASLNMIKGKFDAALTSDKAEATATPAETPKEQAPKAETNPAEPPEDPPAESAPKKRGRPAKKAAPAAPAASAADMPEENEPPAETPKANGKADAASAADMPEENEPAAETPKANGKADAASVPDETDAGEDWENAGPPAEEDETITAQDLSTFITKQVQANKMTVPGAKAVLAKFGAHRCADLKESDLPKAKKALMDECKA